jgi:anti-sigma factor RsiW
MRNWTDKLSDYLDGDLTPEEFAAMESALAADPELRAAMEEIRAVKQAAASLPHREPGTDLWPGIRARIEAAGPVATFDLEAERRTRRRISLSVPQFAAAAVALVCVGSASAWLALGPRQVAQPEDVTSPDRQAEVVASPAMASAEASYETAIRDLEEQLRQGRDRLDPSTVEALERSLDTIDRAIARAQEALEADPASVYLNRHLAAARARKISVLQQAALLAST